jgi:hypothetical protein
MEDVNKVYMHNLRQGATEQRATARKRAALEATTNSSPGIVSFLLAILMHILMALHLTSANTDDAERETETHAPARIPAMKMTMENEPAMQRSDSWTYIHGVLAYECMGDLEMYTGY